MQSHDATLRSLETQIGQLANALTNRPQGTLPNNTENPRREGKEHCKAILLRSGKVLEQPQEKNKLDGEPSSIQKEERQDGRMNPVQSQDEVEPSVTAATQQQHSSDQQHQNLRSADKHNSAMLRQQHEAAVEALEQMPNYVKFMKEILSKKRRLGEFETVALTKECGLISQSTLPPKLKDPGSFTILCSIGNTYFDKILCDLGASINLMSMSVFKQLGIGEARPTTVTLQLADRSFVHPEGKIEDVLVRVDKFIFPVDFVVLDYEADKEVPIILGRPFLAAGKTLIDVQKDALVLEELNKNAYEEIEEEDVTNAALEVEQVDDDSPALLGETDQVAVCQEGHLSHWIYLREI
ncbi:uncharacterized protein LOC112090822 [Morus notabilis]|uniref:uncharacterized protein LOC112090822 n=1 Tax=Morus notabilis TaxID=981085 RepID=UPI000CED42E8|nr:uncharacterized protein LOC112090822 [Morus notabilis]